MRREWLESLFSGLGSGMSTGGLVWRPWAEQTLFQLPSRNNDFKGTAALISAPLQRSPAAPGTPAGAPVGAIAFRMCDGIVTDSAAIA